MEDGLKIGKITPPRVFNQLCILVLDGSGSMQEKGRMQLTKAEEVNSGMMELFNRINASRVKENFSFACIKFDQAPTVTIEPQRFNDLDYFNQNLDPLEGKGGGTNIFLALEEAGKIANSFLTQGNVNELRRSVLILLMTDGQCFKPQTTVDVANILKENPGVTIACAYFGIVGEVEPEAQNLLKSVSSDPVKYYSTVYDGETLRGFFQKSISQSAGIGKFD